MKLTTSCRFIAKSKNYENYNMASFRTQQVGELIKKELGQMLLREIEFPQGTLVTITRVKVTADMRQAKVLVSILPFARRFVVLERLRKNIHGLQEMLNDKLEMKFVPKILIELDKTEEEAAKIESLLDEIKE